MNLSNLNLPTLALLILTPLLVWRIYSRLKGMMQRQRSILSRHYTGLGVFAAMVLVPASELVRQQSFSLVWLAVGTAAGIAYGVWGYKLMKREVTAEGCFLTPNVRLGMVVAMLFMARIMYVGFEIYANQGTSETLPKFTDSPLTLLSLGLVAGYFGTLSAGLVKWRLALRKSIEQSEI
jgi:hypothetical protein